MNDKEKLDMFNRIVSNSSNRKQEMYNRIISNNRVYLEQQKKKEEQKKIEEKERNELEEQQKLKDEQKKIEEEQQKQKSQQIKKQASEITALSKQNSDNKGVNSSKFQVGSSNPLKFNTTAKAKVYNVDNVAKDLNISTEEAQKIYNKSAEENNKVLTKLSNHIKNSSALNSPGGRAVASVVDGVRDIDNIAKTIKDSAVKGAASFASYAGKVDDKLTQTMKKMGLPDEMVYGRYSKTYRDENSAKVSMEIANNREKIAKGEMSYEDVLNKIDKVSIEDSYNTRKSETKKMLSDVKNNADKKIQQNIENTNTKLTRKVTELSSSLGNTLVGVGISALDPIAGTTYFIGSSADSYHDDAINRGMNEDEALLYGTVMGTMEGLTEQIPVSKMLSAGKSIGKSTIKNTLKQYGISMTENAIQESVIEPISEMSAYAIGGKETADFSNMGSRMLKSGIDGALSAVLLNGVNAGVSSAVQLQRKITNKQPVTAQEVQKCMQDIQESGKVDVEKIVNQELQYQTKKLKQSIQSQESEQSNNINRLEDKFSQNAVSEQIEQNNINDNLINVGIANNQNNVYNINESEGDNNEQIQLGRVLEGNRELSGIYQEEKQQYKRYTREEYDQWERNIKPIEGKQLNEQQLKLIDDIKGQYDKDIVFFDGTNSNGYSAGASYINKNRINIDVEQAKAFGVKKVIYHEVAESDILHNKEISTDVIKPAIQKIIEDPNFEKQKMEFWNNQEDAMPSDYLIAKDILCDRFSELKTGEKVDYNNVLSQETNMTIDFSLNNFHSMLYKKNIENDTNNQIELKTDNEKINLTENALTKYNTYKRNILKGRAEEVNTLIKNKNETISRLNEKIAEKENLLNQKADKTTKVANNLKMQIAMLKQRVNTIENEYNSRIDRKNEKVTKDSIKNQIRKETKTTRQDVYDNLLQETGIDKMDLNNAHDLSTINYNRTSPERVNEKVFGQELGTEINKNFFEPVKHATAEKTRFLNSERTDIKSWGIKAKSFESEVLQKYAEKKYVNEKGKELDYTEADFQRDIKDNDVRIKIRKAAQELRQKYDNYIDVANDVLIKLGYDEIPKRKDYVRHFTELNDVFSKFGIPGKFVDALPTDINGITDTFRPGKSYFASTQKRHGVKTTYDAITGIDGYIEGISNLIYHTENIQRLRAFDKYIRENFGEAGFDKLEGLTDKEKEIRKEKISENHLSNYVAWLTEYTNGLAGKKSGIDRSVEKLVGRNIYSTLNTIKKQVGSNMVGFNLGSALTNIVSAVQGTSKTKKMSVVKGTLSTFKNIFTKDDFVNKSDFLTSRFGSDRLSKTLWEKASNAGQVFMNATDYFSSNLIVRSKYYENISKGMSETDAMKEADKFGARILGDRSQGATPVLFNSKSLGIVTQFQFEVFNQFDMMIHDTKMDFVAESNKSNAIKASLGAVWTLGQLAVFQHIFNNLFEQINGNRPAFDIIDIIQTAFGLDDEDEEETIQENLQQASTKLIESLPLANLFSENARIPIASGVPNPIKIATGDSTLKEEASKLMYLLPPTGGSQLKKSVQGAKAVIDGGSYTTTKDGEKKLQFRVNNKDPKDVFKAIVFGKWATEEAQSYDSQPLTEKQQQELEELDISMEEYKRYRKDLNELNKIESDKNSEGNAISGSATAKKAYKVMTSSEYSEQEKSYLINSLNSEDSKYKVTTSTLKKLGESKEVYKYFYGLNAESKKQFVKDLKEYDFDSEKLVSFYSDIEEINSKYSAESKEVKEQSYKEDIEKEKISEINQRKKTEIANTIIKSKYNDEQKLYLYSKSYNSDDVEMAKQLNINADSFIKLNSQQFESDYYANGKAVRNSKQNKIIRYVESLPNLTIAEKAILIKSKSSGYDKYNNQIIKYVDGNSNLTISEKEDILSNLGFKIKNGRVYD